jgi:hypothetical protein
VKNQLNNEKNNFQADGFFISVIILITFLFFLLPCVFNTASPDDWKHPPGVRTWNAGHIGDALYKYQLDHNGRLPSQLYKLIPQYIATSNIAYFFPYGFDFAKYDSLASTSLVSAVDERGAYIYLGERGLQQGLILYERTNLWPLDRSTIVASNQDVKNLVIIVTSNFDVEAMPIKDIEMRLSKIIITNN